MGNEHTPLFWLDTSTGTHKYRNHLGEWLEFPSGMSETITERDRLKEINAELLGALEGLAWAYQRLDGSITTDGSWYKNAKDAVAKAKGERHD